MEELEDGIQQESGLEFRCLFHPQSRQERSAVKTAYHLTENGGKFLESQTLLAHDSFKLKSFGFDHVFP